MPVLIWKMAIPEIIQLSTDLMTGNGMFWPLKSVCLKSEGSPLAVEVNSSLPSNAPTKIQHSLYLFLQVQHVTMGFVQDSVYVNRFPGHEKTVRDHVVSLSHYCWVLGLTLVLFVDQAFNCFSGLLRFVLVCCVSPVCQQVGNNSGPPCPSGEAWTSLLFFFPCPHPAVTPSSLFLWVCGISYFSNCCLLWAGGFWAITQVI